MLFSRIKIKNCAKFHRLSQPIKNGDLCQVIRKNGLTVKINYSVLAEVITKKYIAGT
jgi:hypothetical protein